MSTFKKREQEFEAKFAHDAELKFKIQSRTAIHFARWAAQELGKPGDEAAEYVDDILDLSISKGCFESIRNKVVEDFKEQGIDMSAHAVDVKLAEIHENAEKYVTE